MVELIIRGILSIGTLEADHLRDCKLLPEKGMKKGTGSFDFKVEANFAVCVLQWCDIKLVSFASVTSLINASRHLCRFIRNQRAES